MVRVAIIGGGPAGLMAAERLSTVDGLHIDLFEAMPSVGRKFLMAGKGGMNITHAEPRSLFVSRYGEAASQVATWLDQFGPEALREWMHGLGIASFVGSSGRVFPCEMKAAPLLRAWLHRLRERGVRIHVRHRWQGWAGGDAAGRVLSFATPAGRQQLSADALVLAVGGGSWPQLGADGAWIEPLTQAGVGIAPLLPANCGFSIAWSAHFRERFAGAAVKPVTASFAGRSQPGEFNITDYGVEGGLIYAFSAALRADCQAHGHAELRLDLAPGKTLERLAADLSRPRGRDSLAVHLRKRAGIEGVKAGLLREFCDPALLTVGSALAQAIKALPLPVVAPRPLAEAISSAGGVRLDELNPHLMLQQLPGVFCAGEMLDWEAPTGGYLLSACLASGYLAGEGVRAWLGR